MNSQERMARAMRHEIPDRVPVMCQLALGHYFLNVDHLKPHEIWFTSDRIRTGMPGGGYILSTACSVAPKVAPWKLEMLTPLAEEIGKY